MLLKSLGTVPRVTWISIADQNLFRFSIYFLNFCKFDGEAIMTRKNLTERQNTTLYVKSSLKKIIKVSHPEWKKQLALKLFAQKVGNVDISRTLEVDDSTCHEWINSSAGSLQHQEVNVDSIPKGILKKIRQLGCELTSCFNMSRGKENLAVVETEKLKATKPTMSKARKLSKVKVEKNVEASSVDIMKDAQLLLSDNYNFAQSILKGERKSLRLVIRKNLRFAEKEKKVVKMVSSFNEQVKISEKDKKLHFLNYLELEPMSTP